MAKNYKTLAGATKKESPLSSVSWMTQKMMPTADQKKAAELLGIKKLDSANDFNKVNNFISGFNASKTDPVITTTAKNLGIKSYNSLNDYNQVVNRLSGAPAPQKPQPAAAPAASPVSSYSPEPLAPMGGMMPMMPEMEEQKPQMFSAGGTGSDVDGTATSFRRKRSSARLAGLTTKGTSQFKITGQTGKSSGLNIGV